MIKTILVAATGDEPDTATLAAALTVARPFAAHLDVLHVRFDPASAALAMSTDAGTGGLTAGLIERFEQDAAAREAKAHDLFTRFAGENGVPVTGAPQVPGPSAEWHVEIGDAPRWTATYALAADLTVAPRSFGEDTTPRSTLEAVLLESGRPLLIPPATAMPAGFDRVAIAWKPTAQAARAVALAMPFLSRAKEIVVLVVTEAEARDEAERLVKSLAWHGLAARLDRLPPGPDGAAATLLAALRGRADLLVMGGYGHGRLREWVFGGFTQQVLSDAPIAVFIAH